MPVQHAVFTTAGLRPSEQFDAYRQYCAPVLDITPNERSHLGFNVACEMWMLGNFVFRHIHTPGGHFARSATQTRRDGLDHWVINVIRRGAQEVYPTTGELKTGANVLSIFSLAGPYHARRTEVDWLGLFVPRGAIPEIDAAFDHRKYLGLDQPLGRLVARYFISLVEELPSMTEKDIPSVIQATQAIIAGCATSSSVLDSQDRSLDLPRIRVIRDIIAEKLGSWTLDTRRICKLAGVSRSSLYRMFEPYGGVARYIQRERLRRAHEQLADPYCAVKIGAIADKLCFSDASAFSRAFRHEFGYAPADLRKRSEIGEAPDDNLRSLQPTGTGSWWSVLYG